MIPLPIMDELFSHIAMDIIGPLPRSRAGHHYVLVVCDYATRYPEAVALCTIDEEAAAEEQVKILSRVGMYRLLHVNAIRTSPYHPQTDGVVKCFNQTLRDVRYYWLSLLIIIFCIVVFCSKCINRGHFGFWSFLLFCFLLCLSFHLFLSCIKYIILHGVRSGIMATRTSYLLQNNLTVLIQRNGCVG